MLAFFNSRVDNTTKVAAVAVNLIGAVLKTCAKAQKQDMGM